MNLKKNAFSLLEDVLKGTFFEFDRGGVFLYSPAASYRAFNFLNLSGNLSGNYSGLSLIYLQFNTSLELHRLSEISVEEAKKRNPNLESQLQNWLNSNRQSKGKENFTIPLPEGLNVK